MHLEEPRGTLNTHMAKQSQQLNPNWAELQRTLKNFGSKGLCFSEKLITSGKRKEREADAESGNIQKPDLLFPISNDFSLTDVIAMDCEMVGVGSQGNKSALGRVTLVNKWGNVIYDEYVRPIERVVDFRTGISGIRPQHLRKAKRFQIVQTEVAELLKKRIVVGHAIRNDLKALLLSHPKKDLRDTSGYELFLSGDGRRKALRHLAAEFLGVKIQNGEHCSIEDARAAMLLYQKNRKEWEKKAKDQMRLKRKWKKKHGSKTKNEA